VEMVAIMIAQLLDKAPAADTEAAVDPDPVLAAVIGGTDVQHAIVASAGPTRRQQRQPVAGQLVACCR
jgi:Mn-containing catalase